MKPLPWFGAILLVAVGFVEAPAARGGDFEGIVKEMLGTLEQITKVLATIDNQGTADAARPELKKAVGKMLELRKQAEETKQPTKEEKDQLAKEYAPKFDAAVMKLQKQSARVQAIPGAAAALEELAALKDSKDKKNAK